MVAKETKIIMLPQQSPSWLSTTTK